MMSGAKAAANTCGPQQQQQQRSGGTTMPQQQCQPQQQPQPPQQQQQAQQQPPLRTDLVANMLELHARALREVLINQHNMIAMMGTKTFTRLSSTISSLHGSLSPKAPEPASLMTGGVPIAPEVISQPP